MRVNIQCLWILILCRTRSQLLNLNLTLLGPRISHNFGVIVEVQRKLEMKQPRSFDIDRKWTIQIDDLKKCNSPLWWLCKGIICNAEFHFVLIWYLYPIDIHWWPSNIQFKTNSFHFWIHSHFCKLNMCKQKIIRSIHSQNQCIFLFKILPQVLDFLLSKGADVNQTDESKISPVSVAAAIQREGAVKRLIQAGQQLLPSLMITLFLIAFATIRLITIIITISITFIVLSSLFSAPLWTFLSSVIAWLI